MSDPASDAADHRARGLKAVFLRKMAHEMRTPLSSMLMLAELLADNARGRLGEKEIGYARKILLAGSEIRTLLNEVLELSRVETGAVPVEPAAVAVAELVDQLVADFPRIAGDPTAGLSTEIDPAAAATLTTDRRLLARLLRLLLGHSARAAADADVALRVAAAGSAIEIAISHRGAGVPDDQRPAIFEPFQPGGPGLGLAIARTLAERLGGRLALRAEEAGGARVGDAFVLELPLEV